MFKGLNIVLVLYMYNSIHIKEYLIYDVYHNDLNQIVVVRPNEGKCINIEYNSIKFTRHDCKHGQSLVFILYKEVEYQEKITLKINNIQVETKVNKYPIFENEIILSTMVKNEDNYIKQWIKYHLNIGVNKIIVYDNAGMNDKLSRESVETSSDLPNVLKKYIDEKKVILINWPYLKRYSQMGNPNGQTTQQCHSINAFKKSRLIGLFDIDEYVNTQKVKNIHNFFDNYIKINNCDLSKIGGFRLKCKFFHNSKNQPVNDFLFLNIFNSGSLIEFSNGHSKMFVQPCNVNTFSVHRITNGRPMHEIVDNSIYFNHYIFLNKPKKMQGRYNFGGNKLDSTILENANNLINLSKNEY